jgi:DNA-binding response OmpR family regulator
MLLEEDGHVVCTLTDGAGVVGAVRDFQPDACILDIEMPSESGYAAARDLCANYGPERPLMIAISGKWLKASDRLLALACGFDHFLAKPAHPGDLARILEVLGQKRAAGAKRTSYS